MLIETCIVIAKKIMSTVKDHEEDNSNFIQILIIEQKKLDKKKFRELN